MKIFQEPPKGAHLLKEQFELFKDAPKVQEVIPGILTNAFGFVYGPPKAGKSIIVENLFFYICAGKSHFLNYPLTLCEGNSKCLYISLEERPVRRNERNQDQMRLFSLEEQEKIACNYITSNQDLPPYIITDAHWDMLADLIVFHQPGFVCIDSISRLTSRSIADEEVSKNVCMRLRKLADESNITLLVINHIPKRGNENGLDIFSMSGSRLYAQEADFLLGVNRTANNVRYLKCTGTRYSSEDNTTNVDCFVINDNKGVDFLERKSERQIVFEGDKRHDQTNLNRLKRSIIETIIDREEKVFSTAEINHLHKSEPRVMSKDTFHRLLRDLEEEQIIQHDERRGMYKWLPPLD